MKKLTILLVSTIWSSMLWADINVTQGSGKTVHTDTVNGLEYQAVKIIDGTTGGTSSMTVTAANAALTTVIQSTTGIVNGGSTFNATINTALPSGTNPIGTVVQSTSAVAGSTIAVVNAVGVPLTVVSTGIPITTASPLTVTGSTTGVVNGGTPFYDNNYTQNITTVTTNGLSLQTISTYTVIVTTYAISMTVTPGTGTFPVSGSFTSNAAGSVYGAAFPSTGTTVAYRNPSGNAATPAVDASSNTLVTFAVAQPITSTQTLNVNNYIQNTPTTTFNGVAQPVNNYTQNLTTVTFNGTAQQVFLTTAAVGGSSVTIANWGIAPVITGGQNGSVGVGGLATVGSAVGGRPVSVGLVISSTSWQTTVGDQKVAWTAGDAVGRTLVSYVPWWTMFSTASVNVSSQTSNEFIIISSATAPSYNYLCGCVFSNSSATNSFLTIYNSSSTVSGTQFMVIGTPANDVPSGIWPGCGSPFFRSAVGGQITLKANAVVSNTSMLCQYYQGP